MLIRSRIDPPGTRVPVQLSYNTHALPSTQNLSDRISLLASQHNLAANKPVATLLGAALEVRLDSLIFFGPSHSSTTRLSSNN